MELLEQELPVKIILSLIGIIISLILFIFKNNILKKIDDLGLDIKETEKNRKLEIIGLEESLIKKIDAFEISFTKKIEKIEDEIRLNKNDFNHRFDKYDMEIRLINKEIIILQNEQKHLNKKLNKVDGIDSTEY